LGASGCGASGLGPLGLGVGSLGLASGFASGAGTGSGGPIGAGVTVVAGLIGVSVDSGGAVVAGAGSGVVGRRVFLGGASSRIRSTPIVASVAACSPFTVIVASIFPMPAHRNVTPSAMRRKIGAIEGPSGRAIAHRIGPLPAPPRNRPRARDYRSHPFTFARSHYFST
jgi:hypothetical protein